MPNVAGGDAPLLDRGRRNARRFRSRDRCGGISYDEDIGVALQLEVRVHKRSPNAIVRARQRLDELRGADTCRPNHRAGGDGFVTVDFHRAFQDARDSRGCADVDSRNVQALARVRGQLPPDAPENVRRRFQHEQANLRGLDSAIDSRYVAKKKVVHFRDKLYSCVSSADDYKCKHGTPLLRVLGVISMLAKVDDAIPQL